jgi:hypothetical protein
VKKSTKALIFLGVYLAGFGSCYLVWRFQQKEREFVEGQSWYLCRIHRSALEERTQMFREKSGRWPATIEELVSAGFLPEWSEVHFCPSEAGHKIQPPTTYNGTEFVDNNRKGIVSHFSSSPYHFQTHAGQFTVECGYNHEHK